MRGEYDVVVLGGGPAGIAAAAAAAMHGRKTLLVERYGFLGGMGTAAGVTNFCGLHANVHGEIRQVVHGVADELLARIDRLGGLNAPHIVFGKIAAQAYDTAAYKCAADDLLLGHGADILFHALGAGVVMDDADTIRALIVETKSGRAAVIGRVFIDCSGDGDLAAWAGAPFERGDGAGGMLYPTMMFRVNGVDPAAAGEAWKTIPALMDAAEKRGAKFPRKGAIVRPMKNPIEWRVNVTQMKRADGGAIDGTDADELSARRDRRPPPGHRVLRFPQARGARLRQRLHRRYAAADRHPRDPPHHRRTTSSAATMCSAAQAFPTPSASTAGRSRSTSRATSNGCGPTIPASRGFNHLPYRMLLPQKVSNLLVAGRCASMTHEGQSAARVSGGCFVMGQAAGAAAHLALSGNSPLDEIPVEALQALLEKDGAYLGRDIE